MIESMPLHVDGVPIVAEQWTGNGSPIVLLHAGVCDRRSWYGIAERLTACGRVIAYDQRGFGESPVSAGSFQHVTDLLALLDLLGGDGPVRLVGSSMGGQIAVDAAMLRPALVSQLVLFAPAVSGAPEPEEFDPHMQQLIGMFQTAATAGDIAEMNRVVAWLWLDGPASPEGRVRGAPRELMLAMHEIILRNDVAETARISESTAWQHLESFNVPVTVIWGELDVPFVIEQCEELVERLPNARHHVLPGRAHLPYLEDPTTAADLICAAS